MKAYCPYDQCSSPMEQDNTVWRCVNCGNFWGLDHNQIRWNARAIRKATGFDDTACVVICSKNWGFEIGQRFSKELNAARYRDDVHYYVYTVDGKVIAYAGMCESWIMNGVWDFIWINVDPDFQGQNIGKELTQFRIDEVKRLGGSLINLMTREWPFFERFKFRINRVFDGWAHMSLKLGEVNIYD